MAHAFNSYLCVPGLPGLPLPPAALPVPPRLPRKKPGAAFPCAGYHGYPGYPEHPAQRTRRRFQAVCGIWFLVLGSVALATLCFCCAPISGSSGASLELRFKLDPELFSIAGMSPSASGIREAEAAGRTIAPGESWATSRYAVSGTGPGGAVFNKETSRTSLSANLAPGSWEITVRALTSTAKSVATARGTVLLEASRSSSLDLKMLPVEGNGSFAVELSSSLAPPSGSRIRGSLSPVDGPAQAAGRPSLTTSFPIDLEWGASSVEITEVPAGFYTLELSLADGRGTLAGASETVLILAGFETRGSCRLELGTPGITMNLTPVSIEPISGMLLPVRHKATSLLPFQPSLAGAEAGTTLSWKMNGNPEGSSTVAPTPAGWPADLPIFTPGAAMDVSTLPSVARLDVLARNPVSGRQGSTGALYEFATGPANASLAWKSLYEAKAVIGASLFPGSPGSAPGSDSPTPVKAVAASGKPGILMAAGLDAPSAVHTFRITGEGELFRLWKDEVRINSSARTPDRLALSANGRFAAAAGSSSTWLRIYELDAAGRKSAVYDLTSASSGFAELSSVKAIAFSPDSKRLYVLSNSPESLYTLRMPESSGFVPELEQRFDIDALYPGTSLGMSGLTVAAWGGVAASSSSSSRIFLFVPEITGLGLSQTVEKAQAGGDFTNPESLDFSPEGNDLYVLCDRKAIKHFRKDGAGSTFIPLASTTLPGAGGECSTIHSGSRGGGGGDFIVLSGEQGLLFLPRDGASGIPGPASLLEPSGEDMYGITGAVGSALAGTSIVLAGNSASASIALVEVLSP